MNIILWVFQIILAALFAYSGICKSIFNIPTLIAKGQTGVEKLPIPFIRFIGAAEILGAIGLILPVLLQIAANLTVISSLCLGFIMLPASVIHYLRKEYKNVIGNCILLALCLFVAYGRMYLAS